MQPQHNTRQQSVSTQHKTKGKGSFSVICGKLPTIDSIRP